jgi:probable rRNA maturation factor
MKYYIKNKFLQKMKLIYQNLPDDFNLQIQQLELVFNKVISNQKKELFQLTVESPIQINFITDSEIQDLNFKYRGKNKPTDVLSWSFIDKDLKPHELAGELYVSLDTAKKQSTKNNIPFNIHLCFLITHGLLHVFHYDHNTDQEEHEMDLVTQEILNKL